MSVFRFFFIAIVSGVNLSAEAALINGGEGLIYDSDRNITWTQSANLPGSNGIRRFEAQAWPENLMFAGFGDWRLPSAINEDGSGPCGQDWWPGRTRASPIT